MTHQGLRVEKVGLENGGVLGLVTFSRPEKHNPIDWETMKELRNALTSLSDDETVRVIAITGSGTAFSAGGDMEKYRRLQRDAVQFPQFLADFHDLIADIATSPKPHLALVNGIAVAGGLELILACDVAIAADSARIGDAHQPFGQMGGGGVLSLLAPQIGIQRAKELLFTGRMVSAAEAERIGLVVKVVPGDQLMDSGIEFANAVAKHSPLAIANAKRVVGENYWSAGSLPSALHLERERTARYCLTSEDAQIGLEAFAAKNRPSFVGR